jgi:hypothetical protein
VSPARIEARAHTALYAAEDWADEDRWASALGAWASIVGPDDPITLALALDRFAGDPDELAARVLARLDAAGHPADRLCDLALCPPGEWELVGLVAAADAVVLDPGQAARPDPRLTRRARRVLVTGGEDIPAFRAECLGAAVAVA